MFCIKLCRRLESNCRPTFGIKSNHSANLATTTAQATPLSTTCCAARKIISGQPYSKHFTIVIYNSRVILTRNLPRVVNYDFRMFIRLATEIFFKSKKAASLLTNETIFIIMTRETGIQIAFAQLYLFLDFNLQHWRHSNEGPMLPRMMSRKCSWNKNKLHLWIFYQIFFSESEKVRKNLKMRPN